MNFTNKFYLILLFTFSWNFCFSQLNSLDTTWIIDQNSYRLRLISDPESNEEANTKLILNRNDDSILEDSILCNSLRIELRYINADNFLDLLVFQSSGARANETFNLYVFQSKNRTYKKVIGFNDWPNMNSTEIKGIVSSLILTGTTEYAFFKIDENDSLIDLNISEVDPNLDGKAYTRGINRVKSLNKKLAK